MEDIDVVKVQKWFQWAVFGLSFLVLAGMVDLWGHL